MNKLRLWKPGDFLTVVYMAATKVGKLNKVEKRIHVLLYLMTIGTRITGPDTRCNLAQ